MKFIPSECPIAFHAKKPPDFACLMIVIHTEKSELLIQRSSTSATNLAFTVLGNKHRIVLGYANAVSLLIRTLALYMQEFIPVIHIMLMLISLGFGFVALTP